MSLTALHLLLSKESHIAKAEKAWEDVATERHEDMELLMSYTQGEIRGREIGQKYLKNNHHENEKTKIRDNH